MLAFPIPYIIRLVLSWKRVLKIIEQKSLNYLYRYFCTCLLCTHTHTKKKFGWMCIDISNTQLRWKYGTGAWIELRCFVISFYDVDSWPLTDFWLLIHFIVWHLFDLSAQVLWAEQDQATFLQSIPFPTLSKHPRYKINKIIIRLVMHMGWLSGFVHADLIYFELMISCFRETEHSPDLFIASDLLTCT